MNKDDKDISSIDKASERVVEKLLPGLRPINDANDLPVGPAGDNVDLATLLLTKNPSQRQAEALKNLTEEDIKPLSQLLNARHSYLPENYISPPRRYGKESLSESDLACWRTFRKDNRNKVSLDFCLSFVNRYTETRDFKFSEATLKDNLNVILPEETLNLYHNLVSGGQSLATIYYSLCANYGTKKTSEQLQLELQYLTSPGNKSDLHTTLKKILAVINSTPTNPEELDKIALTEGLRLLRNRLGENQSMLIESSFRANHGTNFRELMSILESKFPETLRGEKKSQHLHHVEHQQTDDQVKIARLENAVSNLTEKVVELLKTKETPEKKDKSTITCYSCNNKGHYASECPTPRRQPSTRASSKSNTGVEYSNMNCVLHSNMSHKNCECNKQTGPCQYSPNHRYHTQGSCRRTQNLQFDAKKQQIFPTQPPPSHPFQLNGQNHQVHNIQQPIQLPWSPPQQQHQFPPQQQVALPSHMQQPQMQQPQMQQLQMQQPLQQQIPHSTPFLQHQQPQCQPPPVPTPQQPLPTTQEVLGAIQDLKNLVLK